MGYFFKLAIVFFSLFDLSFKFSPGISTGKIVVGLLTLFYFLKRSRTKKTVGNELYVFISYFFILSHVVLVYIFNGMPETTTLARVIYYLIYSVWISIIFVDIFQDKFEFMRILSHAIFIQSCFVLLSWFSIGYRIFVSQILEQTGNIPLLSARRPPGLMNSAGAKASVTLGIGSAISLYFVSISKKRTTLILQAIIFVISLTATFIVGRTGLIAFGLLATSLLLQRRNKILFSKKFFVLSITIMLIAFIAIKLIPSNFYETIRYKVEWVTSEFSNGLFQAETVTILKNMSIKELGIDTLFGTSKIRLPEGQHDSGYIQNYHAMGLIFSIIFYSTVLAHMVILIGKHFNKYFLKYNKLFLFFMILVLFIVEIKEPFILSYTYPMIVFTILRLPQSDINSMQRRLR